MSNADNELYDIQSELREARDLCARLRLKKLLRRLKHLEEIKRAAEAVAYSAHQKHNMLAEGGTTTTIPGQLLADLRTALSRLHDEDEGEML